MLTRLKALSQKEHFASSFILAFTTLPFLALCYFNVPLGDDFWYASSYIENGFAETQVKWFAEWSGRYMATFAISTLNPVAFGELGLAFIHPLVLIVGTFFALKILVGNIIDTLKLELNKMLVFSILFFFYLNYIPDFGETFYWMAGAYTYQLPIIFFLIYTNCLIHLFKSDTSFSILKNIVLAAFCLFIILGSNEVIVVYSCFVNAFILLILFFANKKLIVRFLPLLLLTFALSVAMILAPGNFGRAELFEKTDFHVLKSALNAFSRASFVMFFWLPSLAFLMLLIPNIHKAIIPNLMPQKFQSLNQRKVVCIGLLFLLFVLFIGFFPSLYATNWIPQRAYTPIFFVFILFSSILIFLAINKIRMLNDLNQLLSSKSVSSIFLLLMVIALSQNSNVMNAYVDLTSGKANSHSKQVNAAYEKLQKSKDTV